jgi:hypothetical protein
MILSQNEKMGECDQCGIGCWGGGGFEKLLAWETVFSGLLADHDRSMIALTA